MSEPRADVPCNGCKLCCRADAIMLFPEQGDVISSYETQLFTLPGSNETGHILKKGADGNCIYLGVDGCTIHDRAPVICRRFDCRRWYLSRTRTERKLMVRDGIADKDIFEAGRARLHTLPENSNKIALQNHHVTLTCTPAAVG